MLDPLALSAAQLLAIPQDEPERLFTEQPDLDAVKKRFRKLASVWHPDHNTDATAKDVFQHLTELREQAEEKVEHGKWETPDLLNFRTKEGRAFNFKFLARHKFELGTLYIGRENIAYSIPHANRDLAENARRTITTLPFANDAMKKEMERFLPTLKGAYETADATILIMNKPKDFVLLSDLIKHEGGKIDPQHVAWMVSSLYNTTCYLRFAGLTHNDISPDTVFVSPENHATMLLGGWFYAAGKGQKLTALSGRSASLAPADLITTQKADSRLDLELVRATGRELLGDPTGSVLLGSKEVPKPLATWLRLPTAGDALGDYRTFKDEVLPKSFGKRRFVKWDFKPSEIDQPRR